MSTAAPTDAKPAAPQGPVHGGTVSLAVRLWAQAYRVELLLFVGCFIVFAMFSGQRFLRQSAAPHFVYQAKAWLDGKQSIDQDVLEAEYPEDWACVRTPNGVPTRCTPPRLASDTWYSSFPAFPSAVMLPFVAIHGYQLNDTSFGVIIAALAVALFYSTLRLFREHEGTGRTILEDAGLALVLGFGTLFFYAAIRGEVWFSAEVMGVGLTALYLRNAVGARRPMLAGLFYSMAVLTRTPLFFTGVFFVLEAIAPDKGRRMEQLKAFFNDPRKKLEPFKNFIIGAAPLALTAMVMNWSRFGSITEFGHRFFYVNRVNQDIDTFGLFSPHYLFRNLDAAFLKLPFFSASPLKLAYDPWGMSLFLTLPLLALMFTPRTKEKVAYGALAAMAFTLFVSSAFPDAPGVPVGERSTAAWVVLFGCLGLFVWSAWEWAKDPSAPRLLVPVLATLVACVVPGLLYQNTGYAQFGFRFSIDYTPYLIVLLVLGGWKLRQPLVLGLVALSIAVNFWGAVGFRGYTELIRGWQ